jgi:hypothetical protein
MTRSPLTAPLRVYDSGQDFVAAYYIDLCGEKQFVDIWLRDEVAMRADQFVEEQGFDAYALAIVKIGTGTAH